MLLVDVGNTSVKVARLSYGVLSAVRRIGRATDLPSELDALVPGTLSSTSSAALASSVNPDLLVDVKRVLEVHGLSVTLVGRDVDVGMDTSVVEPVRVGTDRLLDALAAVRLVGAPVIVIDMGTAVTVDLVDSAGTFTGGAILPGMRMALRALHRQTAALPELPLAVPEDVVGADTAPAMLAGAYWGVVGALNELVSRMRGREPEAPVVLTGGDSGSVADAVRFEHRRADDLVIEGLRLVAVCEGLDR